MRYRVYRRQSDGSVVGYCEEASKGFEPGGDLSTYMVALEEDRPTMPLHPPSPKMTKMQAVRSDPAVPQSVKDFLEML